MTECTQRSFHFHRLGRREVVARFDGGRISSDGGALLLGQADERIGLIRQLAGCFVDHRDPQRLEHPLEHLLAQRIYGLALGHEDLNDHDTLRQDPLLAAAVGDEDPLGDDRLREGDRGKALAGKSTLNRLELTGAGADERSRYKKIVARCARMGDLLVDLFLQAHADDPPQEIVLDIDATDDPLHGEQLGRFFHGYYDEYCYLPLYVMCGPFVLAARLQPADRDESAGALTVLQQVVGRIRAAWPHVRILIRGDSGFCRDPIMGWCEREGLDYLLGLAKNSRLLRAIGKELQQARQEHQQTRRPARVFADLDYRTKKSWGRSRRVVAKAEVLPDGGNPQGKANPRFVVTTLSAQEVPAQSLYEERYCPRGDMENRIKEQQLCLFADRLSCQDMRANQIRLYFSTFAYTLLMLLRRLGLKDTELETAQCSTLRLRLLKIGARITVTARKVWVSLSSSFALQDLFARVYDRLAALPAWPTAAGAALPTTAIIAIPTAGP